jgi:hypothetical protein
VRAVYSFLPLPPLAMRAPHHQPHHQPRADEVSPPPILLFARAADGVREAETRIPKETEKGTARGVRCTERYSA